MRHQIVRPKAFEIGPDDSASQSPTSENPRESELSPRNEIDSLSDYELIRRFTNRRDQESFRLLVERHAGLVFGVCRQILRRHHDAEDAFQATFLVLAQKADKVRWERSLANWLYGVACRVALKSATRERSHEVQSIPDEPSVPDGFDQIAAEDMGRTLHEELHGLPEKYRAALVLCYLEGKTREQAADELDCTVGTVKGQLERGRFELRLRLLRRGIGLALPAVAGATVVSSGTAQAATCVATVSHAVPAVPESLLTSTVEGATTFASGGSVSAAVTSQALTLAKGEIAMMSSTPILKSAAVATVTLMIVSVAYLMLSGDVSAQKLEQVARVNTQIAAEPDGNQLPAVSLAAESQREGPESEETDVYTIGTESMLLVHSQMSNVITVFSKHTGRWHKQPYQASPNEKVEPIVSGDIVAFQAGNRVYGFGGLKGKWDSFEVPNGVQAVISISGIPPSWAMVQVRDTWYAFSSAAPFPHWVPADLDVPIDGQE